MIEDMITSNSSIEVNANIAGAEEGLHMLVDN